MKKQWASLLKLLVVAAANVCVSGIKSYRSAMGQMTARSAEQAVAYLSEFFFKQGWIAPDKVIRAERP